MHVLRNRIANGLRELRRSERGIALPVALLITVVGLSFAAVPIVASMNSQSGDSHNQGGNEALAAAESGAELAILRQSGLLGEEALCQQEAAPGTENWCPPVAGPIGAASFRYQVRPCYAVSGGPCSGFADETTPCSEATAGEDPIQVVSTGIAQVGGRPVTRRVQVTACAAAPANAEEEELIESLETVTEELAGKESERTTKPSIVEKTVTLEKKKKELTEIITNGGENETIPGTPVKTKETTKVPPPNVYAAGQIVGINSLVMNNNAQVYNGGAGTNGPVSLTGSANVCGTVQYGTTVTKNNGSENAPSNCAAGRTFVKGTTEYPPITAPSDIATNNSNSRLAGADPVPSSVWQRGNISWNASNRSLTVNYESLTLEGTAPYFLCKLTLAGGSKLISGSGKSIKIYFDAPQNCPGLNGSAQLQIANGTTVGADAAKGPEFLFLGSTTTGASKIELGGGATVSQFVVYAPYSSIVANNGVNLNGVIIGRTLELGGGASINKSGTFSPPAVETFLPTTTVEKEVETPGASTTTKSKTVIKLESEITELESSLKAELTLLEGEISVLKNEKEVIETELEQFSGGAAGVLAALQRESFTECSSTPPSAAEAPDSGC